MKLFSNKALYCLCCFCLNCHCKFQLWSAFVYLPMEQLRHYWTPLGFDLRNPWEIAVLSDAIGEYRHDKVSQKSRKGKFMLSDVMSELKLDKTLLNN